MRCVLEGHQELKQAWDARTWGTLHRWHHGRMVGAEVGNWLGSPRAFCKGGALAGQLELKQVQVRDVQGCFMPRVPWQDG